MNNLIAESIKCSVNFSNKPICKSNYPCGCHFGETIHMDGFCACDVDKFIKQKLQAIAEKTREDTKKEILKDIATAYHGTDDSSEGATVLFIKIRDKLSDKESK